MSNEPEQTQEVTDNAGVENSQAFKAGFMSGYTNDNPNADPSIDGYLAGYVTQREGVDEQGGQSE